ncbi:FG-GAP repeat protein [Vibrio sp. MEBiC08052]|uniref:FG-GAP repeat protein n=1 Tax=Vibrio sp. MEBiC08052 TaxID=1761910 RepID=UPI00074075E4|nr:FG-GAP repeat protein [Vibrio sp. MEBiC08052]KUI99640.1 hypothetical protein VRK_10860 [Vibrio sp. MEBiC08052]
MMNPLLKATLFLFTSITLAGCNSGSSHPPSSNAFNLTDINNSATDVQSIIFTWTPAFDNSGVTYKICKKDISQENHCNALTSVTDRLSATISFNSLFDILPHDYFILATSGQKTQASNEMDIPHDTITRMITFFKASNPGRSDSFGQAIALSADGNTLAVGAYRESNGATGVITDGSETTDTLQQISSGAVYLFSNRSGSWQQTAYVKPSNTDEGDWFSHNSISLSNDGSMLAVGALYEDNAATGVITDGSEITDTGTANQSGAVYLFSNRSGSWQQVAYVKASNTGAGDDFGSNVSLSGDGNMLAVGASGESNSATGVITNGSEVTDSGTTTESGAVYLFSNIANNWTQIAYIKASNPGESDGFGDPVKLNHDGSVLAVGAPGEDNGATGVITDGSEITDTGTANQSGAVYLFSNRSGQWKQTAYVKASNTSAEDKFGLNIALSGDGKALAVAAPGEIGSVSGVITDGSEITDTATEGYKGAVYLFRHDSDQWRQITYIKPSFIVDSYFSNNSIALSNDGSTLAVSAPQDNTGLTGVITDGSETLGSGVTGDAYHSGAVYLFSNRSGHWEKAAFVKASNRSSFFGSSVALNEDGRILAVGTASENSDLTGVITDGSEMTAPSRLGASGAVYLY